MKSLYDKRTISFLFTSFRNLNLISLCNKEFFKYLRGILYFGGFDIPFFNDDDILEYVNNCSSYKDFKNHTQFLEYEHQSLILKAYFLIHLIASTLMYL